MFGMRQAAEKDPKAYQEAFKHEPVHNFARRAFYRGTAYSILGVGSLTTLGWLAMGRPTIKEFGKIMQEKTPNPTPARLEEWQLGWFSKDKNLSREEIERRRELLEAEKESYPEWLKEAAKTKDK